MFQKIFIITIGLSTMLGCEKLQELADQAKDDNFNSVSLASTWNAPCKNNSTESPSTSEKFHLVVDEKSEGHLKIVTYDGVDCVETNIKKELQLGVDFQYTTTQFEMELNSLQLKLHDSDDVTAINSSTSETDNCGFNDWVEGVSKELFGEPCEGSLTDNKRRYLFTYELSEDRNTITLTDEETLETRSYSK